MLAIENFASGYWASASFSFQILYHFRDPCSRFSACNGVYSLIISGKTASGRILPGLMVQGPLGLHAVWLCRMAVKSLQGVSLSLFRK